MKSISATEAARRFSELLNRTRYQDESFAIVRGREVVAHVVPATRGPRGSLGDLIDLFSKALPDPGFAEDLERVQAEQGELPSDPWES